MEQNENDTIAMCIYDIMCGKDIEKYIYWIYFPFFTFQSDKDWNGTLLVEEKSNHCFAIRAIVWCNDLCFYVWRRA
jgi:hypothetical protein